MVDSVTVSSLIGAEAVIVSSLIGSEVVIVSFLIGTDVVLRVVVIVDLVDRVGLVRVGLVIFDGLGEVVLGVLLGLVSRSRFVVVSLSCLAKISNKKVHKFLLLLEHLYFMY